MNDQRNAIVVLLLFGLSLFFSFNNMNGAATLTFFVMFIYLLVTIARENAAAYDAENAYNIRPATRPYNVYYGDEMKFPQETISNCLAKYLPYYNCLDATGQEKFLKRLNNFIKTKTFKIHHRQGFIEMPILVSASAIQLSFGMDNYLLPQFEFIHIYPEEFFRNHQSFDVLAGNVSGQSINISWKHFLEGFRLSDDGQNVGLHEMAHAYYYQNFVCRDDEDNCFVSAFPGFSILADRAFETEQAPGNDLYSDYALKNSQEFWAESIEIFFEKPGSLYNIYPDMYAALRNILRQDPLNGV